MIEIKTRAQALKVFGPIGLTAWDKFIKDPRCCMCRLPMFDAVFVRPPKLEPLTDMELRDAYDNYRRRGTGTFSGALRSVVDAHDARLAEIKEQE